MEKYTHIEFHTSEENYCLYYIGGNDCTEYKDFYEVNHTNPFNGNLICQMRADKKTLEVTANTPDNPNEFKSLKEFGWYAILYSAQE
jgi:hypothetical protein